jgi:hypothetical protein
MIIKNTLIENKLPFQQQNTNNKYKNVDKRCKKKGKKNSKKEMKIKNVNK